MAWIISFEFKHISCEEKDIRKQKNANAQESKGYQGKSNNWIIMGRNLREPCIATLYKLGH